MDTPAHGLWTYAIFYRKKYVWLVVLFGVLPDLLSFGMIFLMNIFNGNTHNGPPDVKSLPKWLFAAYNLTHSFVMFAVVFILVFLITRKWFWPMMGWPIHIIIDIPTHSYRYFPTPFLWPVSNFKFNGISWATPWFIALNYSTLMVVYLFIAHNKSKIRKQNKNKH